MSEEQLSVDDQKAVGELVQNVGQAIGNGVPPHEIVKSLVDSGMPEADAQALVADVGQHMQVGGAQQARKGGGVSSWVIWIGIILLFNLLSYVFNWGWIIY